MTSDQAGVCPLGYRLDVKDGNESVWRSSPQRKHLGVHELYCEEEAHALDLGRTLQTQEERVDSIMIHDRRRSRSIRPGVGTPPDWSYD